MKLFIYLLLQIIIFMPVASFAAEGNSNSLVQNQKTEVTEAQKAGIIKTYGKLPLYFIENNGQVNRQVSFYERGAGHATFFTSDGVVLSLSKGDGKVESPIHTTDIKGLDARKNKKITTETVRLSFVGANKDAKITADEQMPGHVNYFIGNDKSKWRSNIPTYGAVTYRDVYKNIDIKFYGNNKNIEHDVIVRPGGDPSVVRFAYKGVKGLKVAEGGDLEVSLEHGKVIEKRPVVYQKIEGRRVAVKGAYRILKGRDGAFTYGFDVASYDRTKDLVIDPTLVYSTYLGGSGLDIGLGIAVDGIGAVYVTGSTLSLDFPITNPVQGAIGGGQDVFITKINPSGMAIVYSTYLGGSGTDSDNSIAVDDTGAAHVTGSTTSIDFPLTNPVQDIIGGGQDVFITKIAPTGSILVFSTYLGGSLDDYGNGIVVDSSGAVYVTGGTLSINFPLKNPIQGALSRFGSPDAFITKILPAGTAMVYSTYLGGSGYDSGSGIAVDSTGAAYVTGATDATDFPTMNSLFGAGAGGDAFITKIDPTGTAMVYSMYLGGTYGDSGSGIAVDSSGAAYVTGITSSDNFPIKNPIQGRIGGTSTDAFVTKVSPAGTALVYSTYLGGRNMDFGYGIAVDSTGAAYVTGATSSTDFPLVNPIQGAFGGIRDAFITTIDSTGTAIVYSTYLGGSGIEYGNAIAVDNSGSTYVIGQTDSSDFPLKVPPIQGTFGGGPEDAFIAKISSVVIPPPVVTLTITPDATFVARGSTLGYNVTATNTTITTRLTRGCRFSIFQLQHYSFQPGHKKSAEVVEAFREWF